MAKSQAEGGEKSKKNALDESRASKKTQTGKSELLLESIPVSLLDESGQIAAVLREGLERIAGHRSLAVLDGLGDFGLDFLFRFDVVEAVFHIEHSSVKVKGYYKYNLESASCQAKKVIF